METRFYCETCGKDVSFDAQVCPYCGNQFSDVRCPICGLVGPGKMFLKGCPACGYKNEEARADHVLLKSPGKRPGKNRRKAASRKGSLFLYILAFLFASLLLVFLWIKFNW